MTSETGAAAAGAGAVAGTAVMPIAGAGADAPHRGRAKQPVVAWIEDPNADELVLMSGDREVVIRDRDLVSRILVATGGE